MQQSSVAGPLTSAWVGHSSGRTIEMQVMEVYHQIARRQLAIRASRLYTKPKPGRKKLVKWPKKLVYEGVRSWA